MYGSTQTHKQTHEQYVDRCSYRMHTFTADSTNFQFLTFFVENLVNKTLRDKNKKQMSMIDQFSHDERHWNTGKDATAGGSFIPLPDCLADRPSVPYSHGW